MSCKIMLFQVHMMFLYSVYKPMLKIGGMPKREDWSYCEEAKACRNISYCEYLQEE